jgi:hypothetical protein
VSGLRPAQGPGAIAEEAPDYRRAADPSDTIPKVQLAAAEMDRLAGAWESRTPPLTVRVEVVAGSLRLTVPGQPVYTLVPESPTRFRLTGPPGMPPGSYVRYDVEGGAVRRMTLVQPAPQPTLTFVRKG